MTSPASAPAVSSGKTLGRRVAIAGEDLSREAKDGLPGEDGPRELELPVLHRELRAVRCQPDAELGREPRRQVPAHGRRGEKHGPGLDFAHQRKKRLGVALGGIRVQGGTFEQVELRRSARKDLAGDAVQARPRRGGRDLGPQFGPAPSRFRQDFERGLFDLTVPRFYKYEDHGSPLR